MQATYTTTVIARSPKGEPTKGELFERGIRIATFSKSASAGWNCWQVKVRFFSDASRTRFESFCDSLSVTETLEALSR